MTTQAGDLLTVREAARRLAVSVPTARRLLKAGKIPHVRPSPGAVRVKPADLDSYIERQTIGGDAAVDLSGLKIVTADWLPPMPAARPRP